MRLLIGTIFLMSAIWSAAQADSTTFDYNLIEDSYTYESGPNYNYGADVTLWGSGTRSIIIRLSSSFIDYLGSSQIIDSARWYGWMYYNGVDDTFNVYGILKNVCWIEGSGTIATPTTTGVSHYDWNGPTYEWGTAGCHNASDDSTFNCTDGASSADRQATASSRGIVTGTGSSGWLNCLLPTAYVQMCYDSLTSVSVLLDATAGNTKFYSTENTILTPYIVIYHHTDESSPAPSGNRVLWHK